MKNHFLVKGCKIITRHHFLMRTIGTRPEEDDSHKTVIILMVTWIVGVVMFSVLEMVFYFLYNMKVSSVHFLTNNSSNHSSFTQQN